MSGKSAGRSLDVTAPLISITEGAEVTGVCNSSWYPITSQQGSFLGVANNFHGEISRKFCEPKINKKIKKLN